LLRLTSLILLIVEVDFSLAGKRIFLWARMTFWYYKKVWHYDRHSSASLNKCPFSYYINYLKVNFNTWTMCFGRLYTTKSEYNSPLIFLYDLW